jgi:AcrR family transcriptional regulator
MKLFWEQGFEGTTFDDLIEGMGISPSTFYNSFGSKEKLYHEAAACYVSEASNWFSAAMADTSVDTRGAFSRLLEKLAYEFSREDLPHGCMISLSGTHQSSELESIRALMVDYRASAERRFVERIRRGIAEGDMPKDCDVEGVAAYANTVVRGLAVQARDGATHERLLAIARIAMEVWPSVNTKGGRPSGQSAKPLKRRPRKI